jgi:uncharacterized damage-inducible protein DinB
MNMRVLIRVTCISLALALTGAVAADALTLGQTLDRGFLNEERDIVPLIEAMPADKFNFAPTAGEFKGVRTFAQQAKHMATVIYLMSSSILEQKAPVDTGKSDAGPESLQTKQQIVVYVKGAFSFGHRALLSLTEKNQMDMVASAIGNGKQARIASAVFMMYHSYDHYGQMVEYLRMNGLIPPSTQQGR